MAPNINKAYQWAINTCNAPNVGYSMAYRYQQTVNGITYYDCSSFIWYALKDAGFSLSGSAFTTRSMIPILLSLGFVQLSPLAEWKPGNILWRQGHTEMVYEGGQGQGKTMGAHTDEYPLADQVSIYNFLQSGTDWTYMFQYQNGATGGYGSSLYVIAAILGNWYQESQLNPGMWQFGPGAWTDLYNGYGLGQWTNQPGSSLLSDMHTWLSAQGYADNDGDGQVAYFLHENRWLTTGTGAPWAQDFPDLEAFLKSNSTNLNDLTHAFMNCWEGLADNSQWAYLSNRQQYAQQFYDYLSANYNKPASQWYTADSYITLEQSQNNAILIYRALSAGTGGGGNIQPDYSFLFVPKFIYMKRPKQIVVKLMR